jgi:ribosomal protein S18 acetylase RimI-like enzyme
MTGGEVVLVNYLELTQAPAPTPMPPAGGTARIAAERMTLEEYLSLYERVGAPLRWDQRLRMPREELRALLRSSRLQTYVLREESRALGFCEFDRVCFPDIELKNFGLVPEAQGRRLGPWLLGTALHHEWQLGARRIWLHTDSWDHPAAIRVYERAGFNIYLTREEPSGPL